MSNPAFYWTPTDETANETASFPRPPHKFAGFRLTDRATQISAGGKAVSTIYDTWDEFELELRAFGPESQPAFFAALTSWWSHASQGGEFAFALDADKSTDTTLSSAASQGDTTVSVNSTASVSVGDWLLIEDPSNYGKYERRKVSAISGADIGLTVGVSYGFAAASVVRHADYLPACIVPTGNRDSAPFAERTGARGANLWDMRVTIRTVR